MIKRIKKEFLHRILKINEIPYPGLTSYSQCGEDLIVQYVFNLRGITHPTYLDIGAYHPYKLSNTALFYSKGCRGINIEANPSSISEFYKYRNEDRNLNIGVAKVDGILDFFIMEDQTLSTFSKNEVEILLRTGKKLKETRPIKVVTLPYVIDNFSGGKFPDFLTIDVEGLDKDILSTLAHMSSCPKVICVEAAEYSPIGAGKRRSDLLNFLSSLGYTEYANTNLNAIMVKNEFWFI